MDTLAKIVWLQKNKTIPAASTINIYKTVRQKLRLLAMAIPPLPPRKEIKSKEK